MIQYVAIKYDDFVVAMERPMRHHNIIHWYAEKYDKVTRANHEQGFLHPETFKFIDRYEAYNIALSSGQIIKNNTPGKLFSEDLW